MPAEPTTTFAALRWLIMYLYSRRGLPSNVDALRDLLSHRPRLLRQRWRRAHTTFHRVPLSARGRRPLNILCLDGGGMRGVAQLAMVEEMEELTGKPVSELFDLVVGTSIGGCGALFVSCFPRKGSAPKMARRALRELQTRCFARTSALRLLWQGQYAADDRRQFMIELCGYRRIHGGFWIPKWRGPRAIAVCTRQRDGVLEPFIFRTYKSRPGHLHLAGTSEAALWQAVEATSAAPLVFPHSIFREELSRRWWRRRVRRLLRGRGRRGDKEVVLVDGGLVANDPTLLALREAHALWPGRAVGCLVSLGTGSAVPQNEVRWATSRLASALAEGTVTGGGRCSGGPRVDQFWRLQPRVKNVSPMEADETKLSRLEEHVRGQFAGWEHAKEICATLAASRADPLSNLRDLCFELVWTAQWAYDRRLRWAHSYAPVLLAWPMYALTVAKRLAVALVWYLRAATRNAYAGALYALRRTPLVREVHRLGYALLAALLSAVANAARALAALFFRLSSTDLLDGQTDDLLA